MHTVKSRHLFFLLLILGCGGFYLYQQRENAPQELAAPSPDEAVLLFNGKILRHVREGVLIQCTTYVPPLPQGYDTNHVLGTFLLSGSREAEATPDDVAIQFYAQHAGLYRYKSGAGVRTIAHLAAAASPQKSAASGRWQPQGTSLDRR